MEQVCRSEKGWGRPGGGAKRVDVVRVWREEGERRWGVRRGREG
jgi:hypothetical protein